MLLQPSLTLETQTWNWLDELSSGVFSMKFTVRCARGLQRNRRLGLFGFRHSSVDRQTGGKPTTFTSGVQVRLELLKLTTAIFLLQRIFILIVKSYFHSLIFIPAFTLRIAAGQQPYGELKIPHGQEQFQMVLLARNQDGTKQGRRCSNSTWSVDDFWAAFSWV